MGVLDHEERYQKSEFLEPRCRTEQRRHYPTRKLLLTISVLRKRLLTHGFWVVLNAPQSAGTCPPDVQPGGLHRWNGYASVASRVRSLATPHSRIQRSTRYKKPARPCHTLRRSHNDRKSRVPVAKPTADNALILLIRASKVATDTLYPKNSKRLYPPVTELVGIERMNV
jgi:hypothetical protein